MVFLAVEAILEHCSSLPLKNPQVQKGLKVPTIYLCNIYWKQTDVIKLYTTFLYLDSGRLHVLIFLRYLFYYVIIYFNLCTSAFGVLMAMLLTIPR